MDSIRDIVKSLGRAPVAVIAAILVVAVGLSAARCAAVHAPEGEAGQSRQEQAAPADGGEGAEAEEGPALSEEQESLRSGYSADVREFVGLLASNVWTSQKETRTLTFGDGAYTESETDSGASSTRTFAVSAYEEEASTEEGANGERASIVTRRASLLTDEGTILVTMRQISSSGSQDSFSLTSEGFEYAQSYVLSKASQGIEVDRVDDGFAELLDGRTDALAEHVSDFCARYYPTAEKAAWSQEATVDWAGRTVSTEFELDNEARSRVSVAYDMDSAEFSIE